MANGAGLDIFGADGEPIPSVAVGTQAQQVTHNKYNKLITKEEKVKYPFYIEVAHLNF